MNAIYCYFMLVMYQSTETNQKPEEVVQLNVYYIDEYYVFFLLPKVDGQLLHSLLYLFN